MMPRIRAFFSALLRRRRMEDDLSTELRFHMDAYVDDLVARGTTRAEAMRRARIEFGPVEEVREECREARGLRWPDELRRNVRYALRVFRRSPAFTIAALATLALCIGANTAIFSVVDAVLLRPLPYPQPERLTMLGASMMRKGGKTGDPTLSHTGENWFLVRDHASALEAAAFSGATGVNLAAGGKAEYVRQQRVSAGFFHVLGLGPALGREFTRDEDRPGGASVAVLSHALWTRAFHGDASVLGRPIMLRGEPYTVIGVMPAGLRTSTPADVWTPLRATTNGEGGGWNYGIVARLAPGVSWAQAEAQARILGEEAGRNLHRSAGLPPDVAVSMYLVPFQSGLTGEVRTPLYVIWAAVGAVLLIGCVNVAGLLLAQGASRTREVATRIALGGGRAAVVRQLLTESLVLALCGSALGVLFGYAGVLALRRYALETMGIWQSIELNARVLGATGAMALLTSVLFGLIPALEAARTNLRPLLDRGGARGSSGGPRRWPRRVLVVGEVALSFVLLVTAGLLVRTFVNLMSLRPGFDSSGVLTAKISLLDARYSTSREVNRLMDQSLARIRALPGVTGAAAGLGLPYERPLNDGLRVLDGPGADGEFHSVNLFYITPEYFRVLRIPLLRGREIADSDGPRTAPVAVVNEAFVERFLRGQDALGTHIGGEKDSRAIVGVVGTVQQRDDWAAFVAPAPRPAVYIPVTQTEDGFLQLVHTWFEPSWIVRTSGAPQSLIPGVTRAVEAVDPLLPFAGFQTMDEVRAGSMRAQRFHAILAGTLGALALLLAAVGIYGLVANSVAARTRELGIRMALGATNGSAMGGVIAEGVGLALAGVAAGIGLSALAAGLLRSMMFGVSATDAATLAATACGLLLVAAAASFVPALRITRLNPAETLRHE